MDDCFGAICGWPPPQYCAVSRMAGGGFAIVVDWCEQRDPLFSASRILRSNGPREQAHSLVFNSVPYRICGNDGWGGIAYASRLDAG